MQENQDFLIKSLNYLNTNLQPRPFRGWGEHGLRVLHMTASGGDLVIRLHDLPETYPELGKP